MRRIIFLLMAVIALTGCFWVLSLAVQAEEAQPIVLRSAGNFYNGDIARVIRQELKERNFQLLPPYVLEYATRRIGGEAVVFLVIIDPTTGEVQKRSIGRVLLSGYGRRDPYGPDDAYDPYRVTSSDPYYDSYGWEIFVFSEAARSAVRNLLP